MLFGVAASLALPAGAGAAAPVQQSPWVGAWQGTITAGTTRLRIVFRITESSDRGDGGLRATMDSPDQGVTGIPVATVTVNGDSIRLDMPTISAGAVYAGRRLQDPERIEGEWRQGGVVVPLALERTDGTIEAERRPQDPAPPYPYREEQVEIEASGIRLAGTLTLPPAAGPVAAVVLISGSGAQDRDEAMAGHRPFLVLADRLARSGVAVLRMDDRGVGGSTGSTFGTTLRERAADVLAMVRFLAARPEVDPERIGLLGHSEGGWVAPLAATQAPDEIAFLVLLAGPAQSPRDNVLSAQRAVLAGRGADEETIAAVLALNRAAFEVLDETPDSAAAAARLRELEAELMRELPDAQARALEAYLDAQPEGARAQTRRVANTTWFRDLLAYDPEPALRRLTQPVLAIYGEHDVQVPADENAPLLARLLDADTRDDRTVRVLPGLNHLLQPSRTGLPEEYPVIETTIAPTVLDLVAGWVGGR
ncbi:MAG TPA: alpha/beta fold hydrolase [Longimicrobiales bacterium]